MKVLFLDIDGVCNYIGTRERHRGFIGIDVNLAAKVARIVAYTNCEVVLSSAWRLHKEGREEVKNRVVNFIDVTPSVAGGFRGDEIKAWLDKHSNVEKYAILDDDDDFYSDQNLFQTSWETGLTDEIMNKVIEFLGKE